MKDYLDLFNQSYARVTEQKPEGKDFFLRFYELFVPASKEIAEKFQHTDMDRQKDMLRESIFYMVDFAATKQASDFLYNIAVLHNKKQRDIGPHLYDVWLDSLIATVREYDKAFTQDTELAWRVVLASGIAYMKFHHSHV